MSPAAEYARRLDRGELGYQRCEACGAAVFPARVICSACWSDRLAWHTSGGEGTIYSASTLHARGEVLHTVALIDAAEGFRVPCRLEGFPPDDVGVIGRAVRIAIEPVGERLAPVARG